MKIKHLLLVFFVALSSAFAHAQKALKDHTLQELNQKRAAAQAESSSAEVAVYDQAIKLKGDIDAALKVEDYDKAASLQQQLLGLKVPAPVSDKIKSLQTEMQKAVAAEDYAKADALKKELELLKNPAPAAVVSKPLASPSSGSTAPSVSTQTNSGSSISSGGAGSSGTMSKNDIYGGSATWMGLDFSLFSFVSSKKAGEEQKHFKYIDAWQEGFRKKVPEKKLAQWLGKGVFHSDHGADNLYNQHLNKQWIVATSRSLSAEQIQAHIQTYRSSNHGLGLVMLPGSFDETAGEMSLYVVWFDLDSRSIVNMQEISVKASPSSMTGRWLNGLYVATKKYVDQYYKKRI